MATGQKVEPKKIQFGVLEPNSSVVFEKADGSYVVLTGQAKVRQFLVLFPFKKQEARID